MKNSILPIVLMLYLALWSIGITRRLGESEISGQSGCDSGLVILGNEARVITGIFFVDKFLSLPHPAGTILEYGNGIKTRSLNLVRDIWTKGIKDPLVDEYEYLTNLGNKLSKSLKLESLLHKAIEFVAKLSG